MVRLETPIQSDDQFLEYAKQASRRLNQIGEVAEILPMPSGFDDRSTQWQDFIHEHAGATLRAQTVRLDGRKFLAILAGDADRTSYGSGNNADAVEQVAAHVEAVKKRRTFADQVGPTRVPVMSFGDLINVPTFWDIVTNTGVGYSVQITQEDAHFVIRS